MDDLKAQMQQLMQQRRSIEAEIAERSQRLNAPGQPGTDGPLVDKEGFPRADVDVHAIRFDRNAIIRLANDHKQISKQLEQLLHQLHALARESGSTAASNGRAPPDVTAAAAAAAAAAAEPTLGDPATAAVASLEQATPNTMAAQPLALRPFAVVDEVAEHSPAQLAGIQLGDQLCRFGSAVAGTGEELQQVAQELQAHEGQLVAVTFMRQGQLVDLQLIPRIWEGRGLLGCHLRPL